MLRYALFGLTFLASAAACGRVGYGEAALIDDSGLPADSGRPVDSAGPPDSGARADSAVPPDSGTAPADSGAAADSAITVDATTVTDSGAPDSAIGAREACCTAWCQESDRFGPGSSIASEAFFASAPGCTSSTGCTCTISAAIANTWTVVTGGICDAHDFATSCPAAGCDGSQCEVIDITGRLDAGDVCTCVGRARMSGVTQDVWDSDCVENVDSVPFLTSCPMP